MKNKFCLVLLFFIIVDGAFLWKPLFLGEFFVPGEYLSNLNPYSYNQKTSNIQWNVLEFDGIAQFYPWRKFYTDSIKKGEFPTFNPYELGGTNFVGNGQSAVFYPLNLLMVLLGVDYGFGFLAFIHLLMMQIFMFLFLRLFNLKYISCIVAAIAYSLCGFIVCWMQLPTVFMTASYLPAIFYFIKRTFHEKSLLCCFCGGLCTGLSVLAGHLQIAIFVIGISTVYLIINFILNANKKKINLNTIILALFFVTFLFVASFQLLPSLELWRESSRMVKTSLSGYESYISNSLHSFRFITAFVPDLLGNPSKNTFLGGSGADYIEYSIYIGLFPLFFALYAMIKGFIMRSISIIIFTILFLLSALIFCGSIINYPLYFCVPTFASMGGPNRLIFVGLFMLAVLSGFGIDYFLKEFKRNDKRLLWVTFGILILLFVLSLVLFSTKVPEMGSLFILNGGMLIFLLIALAFIVSLKSFQVRSTKLFQIAIIAIITIDLFVFGFGFGKTVNKDILNTEPALVKYLKSLDYTRVAFINSSWNLINTPVNAVMPPNTSMIYGIREVGGYDSLYSSSYREKLTDILGTDPSPMENGNMMFVKKYTDRLGEVCDIIVSSEEISANYIRKINTIDGLFVYRIENATVPSINFLSNNTVKLPRNVNINSVFPGTKWKKINEDTYKFNPEMVTLKNGIIGFILITLLYISGALIKKKLSLEKTF